MIDRGPERGSSSSEGRWIVRVDDQLCGLCEVCARHCPTGALRTERIGDTLRLLFDAGLCDGCAGAAGCEIRCTEKALERRPSDTPLPVGVQVLTQSTLVCCTNCAEPFATERKLGAIGRRRRTERVVIRELCPVCRRTQLVVRFIDEQRRPDAKAAYRSQPEILRQAARARLPRG